VITKLAKFVQSIAPQRKYNKYFLYSQIIKNERSKRKLTLAEISKGICSISYLCKFEKNDIIADESYIRAIFERVNLDFNLVGKNILKNGVEKTIKAYLNDDYQEIEELYNSIDDSIFNAQNYLVKCFYCLIKKSYQEFNENIKALDNIKETLHIDDVGVFLFLVAQYYIDTFQYNEANKILQEIDNLTFSIDELNWLIIEQNFNVGFYLADYHQMYSYYYRILINNSISYPCVRKVILRAKHLYVTANSNFKKSLVEYEKLTGKCVPEEYKLDLTYWRLSTYYKGEMYLRVFDEIYDNALYYDARFACLLLLSAHKINDDNYIDIACSIAQEVEFDNCDQHHMLFIKFMLLYLKGKYNHEYVEFLKEKIMPYRNKYMHIIYSKVYFEKYIEFLSKGSRYKEAFSLLLEKYRAYKS